MDIEIIKTIKETNIKNLALDAKFGEANFESSLKYLDPLQQTFIELFDNDYKSFFIDNESNNIENIATQFVEYIKQIKGFDPKNSDFSSSRSAFENNIKGFYQGNISTLRQYATSLWHNVQKSTPDQKRLQSLLSELQKDKSKSAEIIEEYKNQLELLKAGNIAKAQAGVMKLGSYFNSQANKHENEIIKWLKYRRYTLIVFFIVLVSIFVWIFLGNQTIPVQCRKDTFCVVQLSLVKIVFLSLLTYMLSFFSKNYEVNASLNVVNQHKANVAKTIDELLAVQQPDDVRSEIIKQGVGAIFQHVPDGYLSGKEHKTELNIISDIANKIPNSLIGK